MLRLDAKKLELLTADPQKFQQFEPQFLLTPSNLIEDQKDIERFRLVMQQLLMGLPLEQLLQAYPTRMFEKVGGVKVYAKRLTIIRIMAR